MSCNVRLSSATQIVIGVMVTLLSACFGGGGNIPQNITLDVRAVTPSEVLLSWTPPITNWTVGGYDVMRDGVKLGLRTSATTTSFTERNLEPLTRYCYVIYAYATNFSSVGKSNTGCITTPGMTGWMHETIDVGKRPGLALDTSNQPHVSYRNSSGVILASKNGGDWIQSLVDDDVGIYGDTDVMVDSFSAVHLSYSDDVNNELKYASNTYGVWVTEKVDTVEGTINAMSIDTAGNAHMVYNGDWPNHGDIYYVTNTSGSWQKSRLVGYSYASIRDTDILVDTVGVVHVTFTVKDLVCYVHYMNNHGGTWQDQIVDSESNCGSAIAIDSAGNVHIAYSRKFALMHAYNTNGSWQSEQLDSFSWIGGDRVGLAIDDADRLHIAYKDQNADLKYATNVRGTWERFYLDSSGYIGGYPSITVDPAGVVSIVYTDLTNGTVKLVTSP